MKNTLYKWFLPKLLRKSCGPIIPSGEEGEKINCYFVGFDRDGSPYFWATGYENDVLKGLTWDGHSYANEHKINLTDLDQFKIRIVHYYGSSVIKYSSIYDIIWNYFSKFVYINIHINRAISSISQYFFNRKNLVTRRRMELIQFMLDDQINRTHTGIGILSLMTKLYSIKWVLHPSADDQEKKLEIYLDSLVESGELRKVNQEYIVTGKAISTLERYEEEERRHIQSVKLQRRMVILTLILVLVGLLQAGLIKLPTLLDLSNNHSIEQMHNQRIQLDAAQVPRR